MTRTTNARVAGATFLVYIGAGTAGMAHAPRPLLEIVLWFVQCLSALVLGVTLFAITRDEDSDIARLALLCRVAEGVLGGMYLSSRLALRSLATTADSARSVAALREFIVGAARVNVLVTATFFAVGSTLFCWLLLRGRMIPIGLAWLGVLGSLALVVGLPLQLAAVLRGTAAMLMWVPIAVFEIVIAFWFLVKGVAPARAVVIRGGS